ncbi:hypothetical protein LAZ67_20001381 [Cordylochernes scorpioides]|uniref:Peptidase aspartic putative domain-containing protein n=1 Tax=Cordylochernes scorpioides TaxID=51811 RepID=A0ABY6LNT2_9ARAC|nr:hypothetical protein LAZ67_20001381 [Cordylochernes scorpioides]
MDLGNRAQGLDLGPVLGVGGDIRQKEHNVYKVKVSRLNNEYTNDFKFLDQEVISGYISQVRDHAILNELKARGINLTDVYQGEERPIHMLIGSDLLSSILTGKLQILQSGVVATETKLGWTVMGPAIGNDMEDSHLIGNTIQLISLPVVNPHRNSLNPDGGRDRNGFRKRKKALVSKVQYDLEVIEEERRKTVVAGFVANKPKEIAWYMNKTKGKREVTLTQILIVIAWMIRFKPSKYKRDTIYQEELDGAEKSLVKITQSDSVSEEDPKMKHLHAFQDQERLWRMKTRIFVRNSLFQCRKKLLQEKYGKFTQIPEERLDYLIDLGVLDRLRFLPIKKMDQRTCIKFCLKNEIKCADAFRMLTVAYGEATLDRSNVYLWYKMFSEGREDVNDEERAGRPST